MSAWEIALWIIWILWGVLAGFGLWLMIQMDKDDEFEDDSHHWRSDAEFVWTGYAIIYGWLVFSLIWVGINAYWRF